MNWGNKILVTFIVFVGILFTLVYVSVNTEFNLVEDNYYEQELAYEDQIQRIKNHEGLAEKPVFKLDRINLKADLNFPQAIADQLEEGTVLFYRSSTARFDQTFDLELDENGQFQVDISEFPIGAWKIKLKWKDSAKEYYREIDFVI